MIEKDLEHLWQIEVHCQMCIEAIAYFFASSGKDSNNLWAFTHNCYAETAIIHWCKIFGSHNSEPTHFKFFFENRCFHLDNEKVITIESVRERLRNSCNLNDNQYNVFWKKVKGVRDTFFVHNEFSKQHQPSLPDLNILKKTCLEMREIIYSVLSVEDCPEAPDFFKDFWDLVQWNKNPKYLKDLKFDCKTLEQAITSSKKTEQINKL